MHYQKVFKIPENIPYLSIGFDVGANFIWMSTMLPNGILVGKPLKITHFDPQSCEFAISKIEEAQEMYSLENHCFPESIGTCHIPLLCFLRDKGFDRAVTNPIITKNSTNMNVRKLRNDKSDSKGVARVGPDASLKTPIIPDDVTTGLRNLVRGYYYFKDLRPVIVLKFYTELKALFSAYLNVSSKVTMQTPLGPPEAYPLVVNMFAAPKGELVGITRSTACFGETYTLARYDAICTTAKGAAIFGRALPGDILRIRLYIRMYREYQTHLNSILEELHQTVGKLEGMPDYDRISFIQTLYGAGFLSVVVPTVEIGSSDPLSPLKKFYAYFGPDLGVNDSGKFHGDRIHMPKRGPSLVRYILHMVAINNLKVDKAAKTPVNPATYDYYTRKCVSEKRSVAIGAIMHKICNIIFAMLRDSKPLELTTSEEYRKRYVAEHPESVNPVA